MRESVRLVEKDAKIYLGDAVSYNIGVDWFLYEYERFDGIVLLGLAFAALLLILERKKALKQLYLLQICYRVN